MGDFVTVVCESQSSFSHKQLPFELAAANTSLQIIYFGSLNQTSRIHKES